MAFYNDKQQLYLETDTLGVSLGASLLQIGDGMLFSRNDAPDNAALQPITFMSKTLTSAETCYSNRVEALGILHGLETFHHYCFPSKVSEITDHKLPVAIFKKDVASLWNKNTTKNTPIQHMNIIQAWPTSIPHRLAIQTQPQNRDEKIPDIYITINYNEGKNNTCCATKQGTKIAAPESHGNTEDKATGM